MNHSIYSYRYLVKPILELAFDLDVGNNPSPNALFDATGGCINVWCTPDDNPGGDWEKIEFTAGTFCKQAEYVGDISWEFDDDDPNKNIAKFIITTTAYELSDAFPNKYTESRFDQRESIHNRAQDLVWVKKKLEWLLENIGIIPSTISIEFKKNK